MGLVASVLSLCLSLCPDQPAGIKSVTSYQVIPWSTGCACLPISCWFTSHVECSGDCCLLRTRSIRERWAVSMSSVLSLVQPAVKADSTQAPYSRFLAPAAVSDMYSLTSHTVLSLLTCTVFFSYHCDMYNAITVTCSSITLWHVQCYCLTWKCYHPLTCTVLSLWLFFHVCLSSRRVLPAEVCFLHHWLPEIPRANYDWNMEKGKGSFWWPLILVTLKWTNVAGNLGVPLADIPLMTFGRHTPNDLWQTYPLFSVLEFPNDKLVSKRSRVRRRSRVRETGF